MAVERITAGKVAGIVDDHLKKHVDVYDPRSERISKLLVGADGDNGIVSEMKDLQHCYKDIDKKLTSIDDRFKTFDGYIKWLVLLVMGSFVAAIWNIVIGKV